MEGREKEEAKRRMMNKIKLKETEQEISHEDAKRQEAYNMSPRTRGGGGPAGMVKSSSVRLSCLCAPTTHPGSFRCRYHRRNAGLGMSRGISVPSNLSMLAGGGGGGSNSNLSMLAGGGGGGSNSNLSMLAGGGGGGSNSNSVSPKT